jgi:hypothetical protein
MLDTLLDKFLSEWRVIKEAPGSFIVSVAFVTVLLFFAINWHYEGEIGTRDATIKWQDEQLDDYRTKLNGASPSEAASQLTELKTKLDNIQKFASAASPNYFAMANYAGKEPPKKEWRSEEVPLDGFRYEDCLMENVTFVYEGKTPIQFNHNRIREYGTGYSFKSSDPAVIDSLIFLASLNGLPGIVLHLPPGTKTTVPYKPIR